MNILKMVFGKRKVYKIDFENLKGETKSVVVKATNRGDAFRQVDRIFKRDVSVKNIMRA